MQVNKNILHCVVTINIHENYVQLDCAKAQNGKCKLENQE
jgi:hypothetical protein